MVFSEFKTQRHTEGRGLGPSAALLCPAGLHFSAGLQHLLLPGCADQPVALRGVLSPCPLRGPPVLPSSAQRWPRSCANLVLLPPNTSAFPKVASALFPQMSRWGHRCSDRGTQGCCRPGAPGQPRAPGSTLKATAQHQGVYTDTLGNAGAAPVGSLHLAATRSRRTDGPR